METVVEKEIKKRKKSNHYSVDPRTIKIQEGFNVRKDMGDLDELKNSILEVGLQQPLIVKKERGSEESYLLVDGERRLRAIQKAIKEGNDIPYIEVLMFNGNDEDMVFTMITTGTGQKQFTNLEQAEAFKRLVKFGYSVKEIAKKVGKSVPHIYNLLKVADAPKVVKNYIEDGTLTTGVYTQIAREAKTREEQIDMVEKAIEDAKGESTSDKPDEVSPVVVEQEVEQKEPVRVKSKNVKSLKGKTFAQKIKELADVAKEIDTEKARNFLSIIEKTKDSSVEELTQLLR